MIWPPLRMLVVMGRHPLAVSSPRKRGPILLGGGYGRPPSRGRQLKLLLTSARHHPHRLAVDESANVLDHAGEIVLVVLQRHVAEMRRDDDVVPLAQRMVLRQRFYVEYVEAGARDLLVAQDCQHGGLLDDRAARGIDEIGRRLHQAEFLGADEAARALRQHDVDADEIRLPEQVLLAHVVDARLLALLGREVRAPGNDFHAERLADRRSAGAELAEAEDAERGALELRADGALPGLTGLEARVLV